MKILIVVLAALVAGGCLPAYETRILARKIAISTKAQEEQTYNLLHAKLHQMVAEKEAKEAREPSMSLEERMQFSLDKDKIKQMTELFERAQALSISTSSLADLIGSPKELPKGK